uniref:Family with sequence similarity 167 member B n=1 Tax=Cynoglossus semilaevis TaxID=244447 RepID=A0A3P8UHP4_CYNSE
WMLVDPALADGSLMDLNENQSGDESCEGNPEDLDSVKALTEKLKLQTRRPSYLEWQERLQTGPWKQTFPSGSPAYSDGRTVSTSTSTSTSMPASIHFLRNELREMKIQDNRLARQLIRLRVEIHRLKVEQVCDRHKEMLDDASYELEDVISVQNKCDCGRTPIMPHSRTQPRTMSALSGGEN